jgi:hypothetical protein
MLPAAKRDVGQSVADNMPVHNVNYSQQASPLCGDGLTDRSDRSAETKSRMIYLYDWNL